MRSLVLVAVLTLLFGCASTPKDYGRGNYLHVRAFGSSLLMQAKFKSEVDCDVNVRRNSFDSASKEYVSICSSLDVGDKLPYKILNIKAAGRLMVAEEVSFATSEFCTNIAAAMLKGAASNGNSPSINVAGEGALDFTDNCSISAKPIISSRPASSHQAQSPGYALSTEEKLKELKRLFDAGLVSNEVYGARQRSILEAGN